MIARTLLERAIGTPSRRPVLHATARTRSPSGGAGEVERVGRADRQAGGRAPASGGCAQALDGVAERELFAGHAGDEASATNLAARLEPAIDSEARSPATARRRFAPAGASGDDAVPLEERAPAARCRLDVDAASASRSSDHRPAMLDRRPAARTTRRRG
jgi:hypothetical protein